MRTSRMQIWFHPTTPPLPPGGSDFYRPGNILVSRISFRLQIGVADRRSHPHTAARRIGTTSPVGAEGLEQNEAQSSMSRRRFVNRSPR